MSKYKKTDSKTVKKPIKVTSARVTVVGGYNNCRVTVSEIGAASNTLAWSTSGKVKIREKGSTYAATEVAKDIIEILTGGRKGPCPLKTLVAEVKGPNQGAKQVVLEKLSRVFQIVSIRDITSIPHNGCRAKKKRRV